MRLDASTARSAIRELEQPEEGGDEEDDDEEEEWGKGRLFPLSVQELGPLE